eukprot:GHVS01069199.1.p1 GENE.GHVS01069199.1~~GHVS01069199.1.p1  ORF type:complete len:100 (+),score=17.83 GHVS01069199.1:111-410(+)
MNMLLQSYTAPNWWTGRKTSPQHKVNLDWGTPTPIMRWHLPDIPEGVRVYIKRDDMTVRKLEFLMADALHKGASAVVTVQQLLYIQPQSNATTVVLVWW